MITSMIRFEVFPEKDPMVAMIWGGQKRMLNESPGFIHAQLLKDQSRDNAYVIQTTWETEEALDAWKTDARDRGGEHMARMLRGESVMVKPPYEVVRYEILHRSDDPEEA